MRFCPHCGAPLMAGARFCVECGRAVSDGAAPGVAIGSASQQRQKPPKPPSTTGVQLTTAFIVVCLGITILGLGAASGQAPGAAASPADASLPPGHPKIELPTEARTFIDKVEKSANDNPDDVAA